MAQISAVHLPDIFQEGSKLQLNLKTWGERTHFQANIKLESKHRFEAIIKFNNKKNSLG